MLDIKLIRERPDFVKDELEKVGYAREDIDALLELDRQRRTKIHMTETLKAQRSTRSQEIRRMTDGQARETAVREMRELGARIATLEKEAVAAPGPSARRLVVGVAYMCECAHESMLSCR